MYARSTTITGDPGNIDGGIAYIKDEVMPAITEMEGCVGLSMVVDRESGRCIATSSWETEEAMRASDGQVTSFRDRAAEMLGGTADVEEWDVAVMHRDHPTHDGACARISWARPSDIEATLDLWRDRILAQFDQMEGFCSASMFVDRARGIMCGTTSFESRAALDASREAAAGLREMATSERGVEFLDVAEFDLVLAHLRVPELV